MLRLDVGQLVARAGDAAERLHLFLADEAVIGAELRELPAARLVVNLEYVKLSAILDLAADHRAFVDFERLAAAGVKLLFEAAQVRAGERSLFRGVRGRHRSGKLGRIGQQLDQGGVAEGALELQNARGRLHALQRRGGRNGGRPRGNGLGLRGLRGCGSRGAGRGLK
ncbi:hypothetical protein [Cohnella rhizosphaerae]|uniref:Uncharacterized protein n=1 Tax=Cohnella rhizosphaerae TaxID=1457232 RepID=A0A9X4KX93_9BACL|nr:hypothetical protein [Cohnella rhizosphaerae]MDG0812961.1 hypothetical protein [Cohnella rhizosphaerae]